MDHSFNQQAFLKELTALSRKHKLVLEIWHYIEGCGGTRPALKLEVLLPGEESGEYYMNTDTGVTWDIEMVSCKFCHQEVPAATAHLHQGEWVGDDCCWDERLRSSE